MTVPQVTCSHQESAHRSLRADVLYDGPPILLWFFREQRPTCGGHNTYEEQGQILIERDTAWLICGFDVYVKQFAQRLSLSLRSPHSKCQKTQVQSLMSMSYSSRRDFPHLYDHLTASIRNRKYSPLFQTLLGFRQIKRKILPNCYDHQHFHCMKMQRSLHDALSRNYLCR